MTSRSHTRAFKDRVAVEQFGACRTLILPTRVASVVSWRGSITAFPDFGTGEDLIMDLTTDLLDKGTRSHDRFALAAMLEDRGAEVQFSTDGPRIVFSGRALREHVPDVLRLMAEMLFEPLLDPAEFEKARANLAASLHRTLENTGALASGALARHLYRPAHPNYVPEPTADLARLAALTLEEVQAFHEAHFGSNGLVLALVGDVSHDLVATAVQAGLGAWPSHSVPACFETQVLLPAAGRTCIPMPDKQNVDVRMGHGLRVRRQDAAFMPLFLANYVLGGNFSARLMSTVRDEQGLTYGISSALSGITTEYEGHWQVAVTLSHENLERGIAATLAEVRRFVEEGITPAELDEKKTTIIGKHQVTLSSTRGLADILHRNAVRQFDVAYLDTFPEEVAGLTLDRVNEAIQSHFHPEQFHLTMAGLLPAPVDDPMTQAIRT